MTVKIGDVFEVSQQAPTGRYHVHFKVTELPRGRVRGKILKVLEMNHLNHTLGKETAWPKRALFGKVSERWYTTTRLPKSNYPEYYL